LAAAAAAIALVEKFKEQDRRIEILEQEVKRLVECHNDKKEEHPRVMS
jgi:hypothetical protein